MTGFRHRIWAAVGLVGALTLGGCYDDGYGYGGVSVGSGYYGGGYADPYWNGGGYYPGGYYPGGYGWNDGFYYPGTGYYVYDRGGRRQRWSDAQRRYWEARRGDRRPDGRWDRGRWRDGDRNWQGRPPRDGNWQGRPPRDGDRNWRGRSPRDGNWQGRPPQGQDGTRGPGRWRGDGSGRGGMQPGLRDPQQGGPRMERPQRPSLESRPMRSGGGDRRNPAPRVQPR